MAQPFDDLMGRLDARLTVVTTAAGGERAGCVVGFHSQCSMEPPAYAVWLSKANRTWSVGVEADVFAVHFLGVGDHDLGVLFGALTGDEVDKFEHCAWTPGLDGVPLLDVANRFVGRRTALLDPGTDHSCVVLDPIDARAGDPAGGRWLTVDDLDDVEPGHAPTERRPPHG